MNGKIIYDTKEKITDEGVKNSNVKLIPKNTTLLSFKLSIGKVAIAGKDLYTNEAIAGLIPLNKNIITDEYIYQLFLSKLVYLEKDNFNTFGKSLNSAFLKEDIKIPLPPKEIQDKIVSECEIVDKEVEEAEQTIDMAKREIEEIVTKKQKDNKKLEEVVLKISETIDPNVENGDVNYIGLENVESRTGQLVGNIKFKYSEIKSNKTVFQKGDILYGKLRPNLNKVYKADFSGICSTDILVFRVTNAILTIFYKYYFLSDVFNSKVLKTVSGQQLPRTSWSKINSFKIPVPPLSEQKTLVSKIEKLETQIDQAKDIIDNSSKKKQAIMDKYLK